MLKLRHSHRITPLLCEKIGYIGQLDTYEKGSEIALQLLNLEVSDTKIYRLTDELGKEAHQWLSEEDLRNGFESEEIVYGQVDGSMILTREEGWKEVKLGRVFGSSQIYEETNCRNWLKSSEYVAHLGEHGDFEEMMSDILDKHAQRNERLVFINDGARWQWNWIESYYPQATQILDFYHAMEHIGAYISLVKKGDEKSDLVEHLGHLLKHSGLEECRRVIDRQAGSTKTQLLEKAKLDKYLDNNAERMNYPECLKRGLLIGSGAIESAHRTVIQRRMKLSGQRWSKNGASNMLNLRTLSMSGHWSRVQQFYRYAA